MAKGSRKKPASPAAVTPLFEGAEWDFDLLKKIYTTCEQIGVEEMGLDIYPNQVEVITAEQMLDAYASIVMPLMYRHWSFGKHFAQEQMTYRRGLRSLASVQDLRIGCGRARSAAVRHHAARRRVGLQRMGRGRLRRAHRLRGGTFAA